MWFLEFNIVLAVVVVLFNQLLYKKGNIRWNRWVLLSLPFLFALVSYLKTKISVFDGLATIQYPTIELNNSQSVVAQSIDWFTLIYISGVVITLFFFIFSLVSLARRFEKHNVVEKTTKYTIYEGELNTSFFNHIIINKNLNEDSRRIVLTHEKAHADQFHSVDKIIVALSQSLLWFNPFVYLWEKMISSNHEFLADEEVTKNESNENYTLFLLSQKLNTKDFNPYSLTSNMSNLKSRVMKMNEKKSVFRYTYLILPIVAIASLSFTFNAKEVAINSSLTSSNIGQPIEDPDVFPEFKGGNEGMIRFLQNEIKYPKKSMEENVAGIVYVSMIISDQGEVRSVESLKGPNDELKNEAKRVVQEMPAWVPGEKNGKKVAVKLTLPIKFQL